MNIQKLIDSSGRVCGPRIAKLSEKEIVSIEKATDWLSPLSPSLKHRIKALYLNEEEIKLCDHCGDRPSCFSHKSQMLFSRFCSLGCSSSWAQNDKETKQKWLNSREKSMDKFLAAAKKGRESQKRKYGGCGFQRKDIQEKVKESQVSGSYKSYKWKTYGDTIKIQGFEDLFLDKNPHLIKPKSFCPKIKLEGGIYWPDFYDDGKNTLYEIKGIYTLVVGILDNTLISKLKASLDSGYVIELHVFKSRKDPMSWALALSGSLSIDDIESSLASFLTNIVRSYPCVLRQLGQTLYESSSEWLNARTG